jgi:hypothetical protein
LSSSIISAILVALAQFHGNSLFCHFDQREKSKDSRLRQDPFLSFGMTNNTFCESIILVANF